MQQQDNSDDENIINARRVLQSDDANDDVDQAPDGYTNDLNILYARAIVVKQVTHSLTYSLTYLLTN